MKKWFATGIAFLVSVNSFCTPNEDLKNSVNDSYNAFIDIARAQFIAMDERLGDDSMPCTYYENEDRIVNTVLRRWISGFFPGSLWYLYELSGDEHIKHLARKNTHKLDCICALKTHHDIGFQVNCSFGNEYRITGDKNCLPIIEAAAAKLARRFSPVVGCIKSWDSKDGCHYPVIIDNMMNLELLVKAADLFGCDSLKQIAISHADKTLENHFRPDFSCYHLVDYNPETGAVDHKQTVQGYADESSWSRGQSWAVYGYTMMYEYTGDPRYLTQAENVARYLLSVLPKDAIPAWDFNAPGRDVLRDASAGAVIASAFVSLSGVTKDRVLAETCLKTARKAVETLMSDEYLAEPGTNGNFLLKHGVGNLPGKEEIDVPLSYLDYYFLETLVKLKNLKKIKTVYPFVPGSKVNAIATCKDTMYVGGIPGNMIYRIPISSESEISSYMESEPVALPGQGIKQIIADNDYLYVCTRGNGSGMITEKKYPVFLAAFEEGYDFGSVKQNDCTVSISEQHCPSRWNKSLNLKKKAGMGAVCLFTQNVAQATESAEFVFWLKINEMGKGYVDIPLIHNVLSVSADSRSGKFGLTYQGRRIKGDLKYGEDWINVKVTVDSCGARLCVRGKESPSEWSEVCSVKGTLPEYSSICLGVMGTAQCDILLDDYAYCPRDVENTCYINGSLNVYDRHSLKLLTTYKLNLRCLSMLRDGDFLYLGMIGGMNVYSLKNPAKPELVGTFRESSRSWTSYPADKKAAYSYKVRGDELQRMDLMTLPDGRKIIVGGSDTQGIICVDVTDPCHPTLFKQLNTIQKVKVRERAKPHARYIEWAVVCDYPYVYTSVASIHSLVHNEFYSGKYTSDEPLEPLYGIKVYDFSNPDAIRDTLISVPSRFAPVHIAVEGDSSPNSLARIGKKIYANFADKGIAVFTMNGWDSTFDGIFDPGHNSRIRFVTAFGDKLLAGDGAVFGPWKECNIYLILSATISISQIVANIETIATRTESDAAVISALCIASDKGYENANDSRELYLKVPITAEELQVLLEKQNIDGSWKDIDYADPNRGGWQPSQHAMRTQRLAIYYRQTGNRKVLESALRAIDYWNSNAPVNSNWWHNEIGIPRLFGPAYVLLKQDMTPDQLKGAIAVMDVCKFGRTGQNKIWQAGNVLLKGLLEDNVQLVSEARDTILSELKISVDAEGLQDDYSFHQHGPQLQFGNYGLSYAMSLSWWAVVLQGTGLDFPEEKMDMLKKYVANGLAHVVYEGMFDHNACGRQVFPNAQFSKALCVKSAQRILSIPDSVNNGGRYFPRSDFGVYRGKGWYASVRMHSHRTKGFEMSNRENMKGYFSADGALLVRVEGDEYDGVPPIWDWRNIPGSTTWSDNTPLWGNRQGKDHTHGRDPETLRFNASNKVGGLVSDGKMIAAIELDRDTLKARKAYFFFEDGVICLGAGITKPGNAEVTTTIEQNILKGDILQGRNWAQHRGIRYQILQDCHYKAGARHNQGTWRWISPSLPEDKVEGDIFEMVISHGSNPVNASYAYAVLPTGKKLKDVKILSNTSETQSVRVGKISMTINWDSFEMFITESN